MASVNGRSAMRKADKCRSCLPQILSADPRPQADEPAVQLGQQPHLASLCLQCRCLRERQGHRRTSLQGVLRPRRCWVSLLPALNDVLISPSTARNLLLEAPSCAHALLLPTKVHASQRAWSMQLQTWTSHTPRSLHGSEDEFAQA